jgi:protein subunit release factor B
MGKPEGTKPILTITIKDCEVQHFRSGGKGGQNQNKVSSGSRVIHHPSGARGESREFRDQPQNTRAAFKRMAESKEFQAWARLESLRRMGVQQEIERRVDESLVPANLICEVKSEDGRWVVMKGTD